MSSSTAKNLERITASVEQHDSSCESKGKAVCLNPYEFERLGFDSVFIKKDGRWVPIKPDDTLGTGRLRVVCDGYHGPKKAIKQEDTIDTPAPAERELVPVGAPPTGDELVSYARELGLNLTPRQERFFRSFGSDWQCSFCGGTSVSHRSGCPFS
jgi:hypothetical protein